MGVTTTQLLIVVLQQVNVQFHHALLCIQTASLYTSGVFALFCVLRRFSDADSRPVRIPASPPRSRSGTETTIVGTGGQILNELRRTLGNIRCDLRSLTINDLFLEPGDATLVCWTR
jgi:hypothetical protein